MEQWNVPVMVIKTIKKLVQPFFIDRGLTIDYKIWIETLSQNKIEDTKENRILLETVLEQIKDKNVDFHIMNVEGFISSENFEQEHIPLREKMEQIYKTVDFDAYLDLYKQDINKMKLLFLEMIQYVSYMQKEELVIFKYRAEVSFYDLWNEFYMECRGVIIDLKDMALVATPYRKFFNFNEKPATSAERITSLLKEATQVVLKNKEDGSMVSVTKYKEEVVVATPGSMESSQSTWAKEFLIKHYSEFLNNIPRHTTFIFEAIYPENRIVIDYQGAEKMVLTNMRSIVDGTYFEDDIVERFALNYKIPRPEGEYKSLSLLLEEVKDKELHPADKKEGWVFTVKTQKEELMFKLKCEDYCLIHKVMGVANSPKIVFEQIIHDTFDDFISKVPDVVQPLVYDIASVILSYKEFITKDAKSYLSLIPEDLFFTKEEQRKVMDVKTLIKNEIAPIIDDRLSKNKKTELEDSLLSKVFGKERYRDKYVEKEFQRLWAMIPLELQNQTNYKQKEGKLLGLVHKQIPPTYKSIALDYARGLEIDFLSLMDIKEIDFSFLKERNRENNKEKSVE